MATSFPLAADAAPRLFTHIAQALGSPDEARCNHNHRLAREWCDANDADWPTVEAWLLSTGGFCDCEVLFNSASKIDGEW